MCGVPEDLNMCQGSLKVYRSLFELVVCHKETVAKCWRKAMGFLSYCLRGDNTLCNLRTSQRGFGFDLRQENLVHLVSRAAMALCPPWSVNDKGYIAPWHLMEGLTYSPMESAWPVQCYCSGQRSRARVYH